MRMDLVAPVYDLYRPRACALDRKVGERVDFHELSYEVSDQLAFRTGLRVRVEMHEHTATLSGSIPSAEARTLLLSFAAELMPRWQLVDELHVQQAHVGGHVRAGEWQWVDVVD
jgi:hypothetical protein